VKLFFLCKCVSCASILSSPQPAVLSHPFTQRELGRLRQHFDALVFDPDQETLVCPKCGSFQNTAIENVEELKNQNGLGEEFY
jgi:hypothetical protein